jgi:predicted nucleotidyltransferase
MTAVATYPAEAAPLIEALLHGIRDALGENLLGFYLRGSLALGGFDPETSDVDVLVVTERPVSEAEFETLDRLHTRIRPRENEYDRSYEVSYVDQASLKRFEWGERRHPTVGSDWAFGWAEHRDNFVLERWVVRERGVVVAGPDPKTLIDPISADDLRAAVVGELHVRMEHWAGGEDPPAWLGTRYYQAFEIETLCRALYTLEMSALSTKRQAVEWALQTLPEPWHALVEWSREYHADKTADGAKIPQIMRFARWAAARAHLDGALPATTRDAVAGLLERLTTDLRATVGENLVGIYLCGSLALAGFDPKTSDVDVLVVTEGPPSEEEMAALKALHERLPPRGNEFGQEYEVYYIDRATLRRFAPGQHHVKVAFDDPLGWTEHRPNWVLERWTVREHGVTLIGPRPKTLIEPVSAGELRQAAGAELRLRLRNWTGGKWPFSEMRYHGTQAFEVETVCRALHTAASGEVGTKRAAIGWALASLPSRWHALIRWAEAHRKEPVRDDAKTAEVLEFLRWGVGEIE